MQAKRRGARKADAKKKAIRRYAMQVELWGGSHVFRKVTYTVCNIHFAGRYGEILKTYQEVKLHGKQIYEDSSI